MTITALGLVGSVISLTKMTVQTVTTTLNVPFTIAINKTNVAVPKMVLIVGSLRTANPKSAIQLGFVDWQKMG